jgi:IPTL-CTERM motif
MNMRTRIASTVAFLALILSGSASAQTLYAATGSNGVPGQLFTVNPATAAATLVGPILDGVTPIAITGLAFHPTTGVLYAVSAGGGGEPRTFFTINPATGAATRISALGALQASDLSFNAAGVLFAWQQTNLLATVNLATGVPTPLGASGIAGTTGGGLAINGAGTAFLSATTATGTLDTVNTATGAGTTGPAITGAVFPNAMDAMAFSGGTLFAVNTNTGGIASTHLVTINTATGAVTDIGALPNDTDAIAFSTPVAAAGPAAVVPTLSTWALVLMMLLIGTLGTVAVGLRKK